MTAVFERERAGYTHKVHIRGMAGYLTVNPLEDGTPGEIFIHGFGKLGTDLQSWADAFAIMLSLYMQAGGDLAWLAEKFKDKHFFPCGETDNPAIPTCQSLPDYIFRWIAYRFDNPDLQRVLDAGGI